MARPVVFRHESMSSLAANRTADALQPPRFLHPQADSRRLIFRSPLRSLRLVILLCLCGSLLCLCASDAVGQISELRLGIDNQLRQGEWAPISLTLDAAISPASVSKLEVESVDGDGAPAIYEQAPVVDLLNPRQLTGWFRLGASRGPVSVRLKDSAGELIAASTVQLDGAGDAPAVRVLPLTTRLVAIVGLEPTARTLFSWTASRGESLHAVFLSSPGEIPLSAIGLRNLDTLVLSLTDASQLEQMTSQRQDVLEKWVRAGGKLLFWIAPETASEFVPNGRLSSLIPGELGSFEPLPTTSRLDFLLKAKQPLIALGEAGLPVAQVREPIGNVLVAQEQSPLLVRRQMGLGQVTFMTFAADREPLRGWEATPRLLDLVLTQSRFGDERGQDARLQATAGPTKDLLEQFRSTLERFSRVNLINFTTVALLIGLLVLLVGPGDWFFLRSLPGRRMELTWLTFPLLLAGFCGLTYWLSARSHPKEIQFNQFEVVDIDVGTNQLRGTSWTSIYSPRSEARTIRGVVAGEVPFRMLEEQVSWLALPGGPVGSNFASGQTPYRHVGESSDGDVRVGLVDFPFPVRSTRSLVYEWFGESQLKVRSQLQLDSRISRLGGNFTNPFDVTLTNCRIYYEDWAYVFEQPLAPGDTVDLLTEARERTIKSILTQRERASSEGKSQNAPWNPREDNPLRILEMMMFHEMAGGQTYTGLTNRARAQLEMSEQLQLKQAIFVAELPRPLSGLQLDGQSLSEGADRRHAFIRLSVPVILDQRTDKKGKSPNP